MKLISMYPTEWDLSKQDKEELMMLLGLSAREWEQRAREQSERLAKGEQTGLRLFGPSAGEFGRAQPQTSSLRGLVAAAS